MTQQRTARRKTVDSQSNESVKVVSAHSNYLVLFATIALLSALNCRAAGHDPQIGIETILAEEGLTGAAWLLIHDDAGESLGAVGMRDSPSQTKFTVETRFHVGSLTKSVLATGILRLVTEKRLELDAPVSRYLPKLQFENPWKDTAAVTVRHLLDHTSGLSDGYLWQMFSERPSPHTDLLAAFPRQEVQLRLRSMPGSRFSYSNMGYTLLGMVIESITGERYEPYLDEHLLGPLGMHESTFAFTSQQGTGLDPTLAWGHVDDGSRSAASPMFLRPAGQFTTTTSDLARFAKFLLSDGTVDHRPFIDRELMRARGSPSGTEAANAGLLAGYSLGLGRRDRHGVIGYCHGGNITGFYAMLCIFPDENKAFAYSVNTDSETADYGRIDRLLIAALGVTAATLPQTIEPAAKISDWHGRYIFSPNRFRAFEYLDNVFGALKISADGDSLLMESLQNSPRQLRPVAPQIYSANDRATASHVFLRGEEDRYLLSDGFKTYEKVSSIYLGAHWTSIVLGLAGLVWLFLAGVVSLVSFGTIKSRRTIAPAFVAILLLFAPIPFFMTQSFMVLGDVTVASVLLAAATLLLPLGMLMTIFLARKSRHESRLNLLHGLAAACVLQWCVVLAAVGMLPLRLWI